jgi:hypothetical protein
MTKPIVLLCAAALMLLVSCGGGADAPATSGLPTVAEPGAPAQLADNQLPILIDQGPAILWFTGHGVVNIPYASVTVCTGPNGTGCQLVDHLQIDTGSVGLRIFASALSEVDLPAQIANPVTGRPLLECVQFADGYTWGSVVNADVRIGGRAITSMPVNLIADPRAGTAPPSCVSGPAKDSVTALQGNGVLGIGAFVRDCGATCTKHAVPGIYYECPAAGTGALCQPTVVPLLSQVANPVASLDSDNNGVTIAIQDVPPGGAALAHGSVYFGVGTRDNNGLRSQYLTVDDYGAMLTTYAARSQMAVIDTGSNGYFFTNTAIARCSLQKAFYCPTTAGAPASLAQTAVIVGHNGASQSVVFHVDNLDATYTGQAALPGVAAPSSNLQGGAQGLFVWGLPFFYGRTVQVLFEGRGLPGATGPAVSF